MEQNLAILIDFENIATGTDREGLGRFDIRLVMNRFKDKGRILVSRSYADWGRYAKFKQDLLMQGVQLFELTSHGMQDKNRADIALVVDCMDLAFTKPYIDTFVVLSGDSDFTPLVLKLKEMNKRVIGCGTRRSTSRLIVEACDEFIFYDSLKKSRRASRPETPAREHSERGREVQAMTRGDAADLLVDTLDGLLRENAEAVPAGVLKQAMLRKEPAFSENDLGYSSYGRFIEACRDRGMIQLSRDEKAGSYRVEAPSADDDEVTADSRPSLRQLAGEPAKLQQLLESDGLDPLTPELRREIVSSMIDAVAERAGRGLKSTVRYVHQDTFKSLIGTHPALSSRHVKAVVKALHIAESFLHPNDAQPVRSLTAGFILADGVTPELLLGRLPAVYVGALKELGVDLATSAADVAEVIFNDRGKTQKVEEIAAWESLSSAVGPSSEAEPAIAGGIEGALNGASPSTAAAGPTQLDAVKPAAVKPAATEPAAAVIVAEPAQKTPRRRARRKKGTSVAAIASDSVATKGEAGVTEGASDEVPPKTAAKSTRTASTKKAATKKAATKKAATKKAATKKAATKKAATKKAATKKAATRKTTTRKAAAKKSTSSEASDQSAAATE